MSMDKSAAAASAAALLFLVFGCRTDKDILNDYEKALLAGDYSRPVAEIEGKAADGGVDELMWRLHAGGSRYMLNDCSASIEQFDKAEDMFLQNDKTGVFKQGVVGAFAMVSNDRAFPYAGGGEDRIFTCFYKAVDYMCSGDTDAARTELNRAAQHQDNWLWERRKEIADAADKLRSDADAYAKKEGGKEAGDGIANAEKAVEAAFADSSFAAQVVAQCDFDMASDGNVETLARKDWLNRYVQHVTALFRVLSGDGDGEGYLRELAAIDPENPLVRADLQLAAGGARPQDMVWVFVEDGLGPVREEWRLDLPVVLIPYANRYVLYAGMALPYLRQRGAAFGSYSMSAGGESLPLAEVQDVDRLAKTEFDVYFRGALTREITRTVVKVGVQAALGVVADNCSDSYTRIALKASQAAAAAWAALVTQADLRSWTGLPKRVAAMRVKRPADGRVSISGDGAPVAEIDLPAGNSLVFVRKTSSVAPAVVKTATFP